MSKLRTVNDLQDKLDNDLAWRIKELANLKELVRRSPSMSQKTAIRSAICLAYAHWEGFVKLAAENYISFVSNQRLSYEQLSDCFVVIGARRHMNELKSGSSASASVGAVTFLRNGLSDRAYLSLPGHVKTKSNLNSEVFQNIADTIGIDTSQFSSRYNQIDAELLARRNRIAHGEYLDIGSEVCRNLLDDVILLLRYFKSGIEQAASTNAFRLHS